MNMMLTEAIDRLTVVTKIQSDVIDELFLLLMQYMDPEEVDTLPAVDKINRAAMLRRELGEGDTDLWNI